LPSVAKVTAVALVTRYKNNRLEIRAMRKLELSDWASIAEIIGMAGVIISLVFVAVSLERNTAVISGQTADQIYESSRSIDELMLQDPELLMLTVRGRSEWEELSAPERERYLHWVGMNIDLWEQMIARKNDGLVQPETMTGWNEYFIEFTKRHLTLEMWNEISWWWPGGGEGVTEMVELALSESSS
jgi:hypothetical protein